jgi:hypothetical protein
MQATDSSERSNFTDKLKYARENGHIFIIFEINIDFT